MTRRTGWVDPQRLGRPEHTGLRTAYAHTIPSHVRLDVPAEVYDQAAVGSCVAQALACAVEVVAPRAGYAPERPDRTVLYYLCRRSIGTVSEDSGAIIADGLEVLRGGWTPELTPPSTQWDESYTAEPPRRRGDEPRVVSAEPLAHDVDTVLWELACGHPVVVGLRITEQWDRPGEVIGAPSGEVVGGHAVCLAGYQRDAGGTQVRVRNSWGTAWADSGEAWLDAAWLSLGHCGELHAIRAIRRTP